MLRFCTAGSSFCQYIPLCLLLAFATGCDQKKDAYVRLGVQLWDSVEKKKRLASLGKGEKVQILQEEGSTFVKLRLSDGQEGYIEKKYLAQKAFVLNSSDVVLKRRPDHTAPNSRTADHISMASLVFVIQSKKNSQDETWWEVKGGYPQAYFYGWLPATTAVRKDAKSLRLAVDLEDAIRKKNITKLEDLSKEEAPIGEKAASYLMQLQERLVVPKKEEGAKASDNEDNRKLPSIKKE